MQLARVIQAMIGYNGQDVRRIQHLLKVFALAKTIGEAEALEQETQEILEVAAVVHDIGIKISEEKYGKATAKNQEEEGPAEAYKLLKTLGYESQIIERVCYLVGHHHSYDSIVGRDYQILVEADFLVNIDEDHMTRRIIEKIQDRIFKTKTGTDILTSMYLPQR
ncbi:MAG: HD domain-containing protein [Acetobacterium sp.]